MPGGGGGFARVADLRSCEPARGHLRFARVNFGWGVRATYRRDTRASLFAETRPSSSSLKEGKVGYRKGCLRVAQHVSSVVELQLEARSVQHNLFLDLLLHCVSYTVRTMADEEEASSVPLGEWVEAVRHNILFKVHRFLRNGRVDVHDATYVGPALRIALIHGHIRIIRVLLDYGAKANTVGSDGMTVIEHAVRRQKVEIVQLLLENQADPNAILRGIRATLLHLASSLQNVRIVGLLLQYGADIEARDAFGETPLYWGLGNFRLEHKLNTSRFLLENGADSNTVRDDGRSILRHACFAGRVDAVRLLLNHGAAVNARDAHHGKTALHQTAVCPIGPNANVLEVLLERGANPKISDNDGMLPLELACEQGGSLDAIYVLFRAMPGDVTLKRPKRKNKTEAAYDLPK